MGFFSCYYVLSARRARDWGRSFQLTKVSSKCNHPITKFKAQNSKFSPTAKLLSFAAYIQQFPPLHLPSLIPYTLPLAYLYQKDKTTGPGNLQRCKCFVAHPHPFEIKVIYLTTTPNVSLYVFFRRQSL
jgi:hypothetical protein